MTGYEAFVVALVVVTLGVCYVKTMNLLAGRDGLDGFVNRDDINTGEVTETPPLPVTKPWGVQAPPLVDPEDFTT